MSLSLFVVGVGLNGGELFQIIYKQFFRNRNLLMLSKIPNRSFCLIPNIYGLIKLVRADIPISYPRHPILVEFLR